MCMTVQTSAQPIFRLSARCGGDKIGLNEPSLQCALAAPPEGSRRARSGGMSRDALVTLRWQSAHDKTRVSSINKRRVISVPEEAAASAEAGASGLDRSGAPVEVWTREVASGCATSLLASSRRGWSYPVCTPSSWAGSCLLAADGTIGLPSKLSLRRGPDCPPTIAVPRGADPGGPPPSGPVPAPSLLSNGSTGSSTVGIGRRASIACCSILALSDFSQAALTSSGAPHDDAIPVDLALRRCARAPFWRTSTTLARGLGAALGGP